MQIKTYNLSNICKPFSYSNVVQNGTFSGTTGWEALSSTISASNNTLFITGNGTNTFASARITNLEPYVSGKKYYVRGKFKVTNSNCNSIQVLFVITGATTTTLTLLLTPLINVEYDLSAIGTLNTGGSGNIEMRIYHRYSTSAIQNGKIMEVKDFLIADLTTYFGSGNEPDAEACKQLFKYANLNNPASFSTQIAT